MCRQSCHAGLATLAYMLLSAWSSCSLIDRCRPPVSTHRRVIPHVRGIAAGSTGGRREPSGLRLRGSERLDPLAVFDGDDSLFPVAGHSLALANPAQLSVHI